VLARRVRPREAVVIGWPTLYSESKAGIAGRTILYKRVYRRLAAVGVIGALAAVTSASLGPAGAAGFINWPSYGRDPAHDSYQSAATAITPANAAALTAKWHWSPVAKPPSARLLYSSAITDNGVIYIGADTGDFYALSEATGKQIWRDILPYTPAFKAGTNHCPKPNGIEDAAAVAKDPVTGRLTVYIGGGDTYLRAIDAATGHVLWKSENGGPYTQNYFSYSSPTVAKGRVYEGIASHCQEVTRGGLSEFDQHTGALLATYFTVPAGSEGGGIWSTAGIGSNGGVYATTGNGVPGFPAGDSLSIVRLDPNTLTRQDISTITSPPNADSDFGASPTFFSATIGGTPTSLVGACNKNGVFYAWNLDNLAAGPVWSRQVGIPNQTSTRVPESFCADPAVWDGAHGRLFIGANQPTPTSTANGSAYELDPATGDVIWETDLPAAPVIGAPSLDGGGVLAVPTWNAAGKTKTGAVYLLNASTGTMLVTLVPNTPSYAQPVFADKLLLVAAGQSLTAYGP
jgi:polyvinyl alcohol dehydrogenase (cytochrome)